MTETKPDQKQIDAMADAILTYCRTKPDVSFAELSRDIPGFNGEFAYEVGSSHVLLWSGLSLEAGKAAHQLFKDGLIDYDPCHPLAYHIDGAVLNLPLVRGVREHKTDHWLPVLINVKGAAV